MEALTDLLGSAGMTGQQALMLLFLLLAFVLLLLDTSRLRAGKPFSLRNIRAFAWIRELVAAGAETGRPVHMSLGVGGIADTNTAESLAGVTLMQQAARESVSAGAPFIATVSDPTLFPLALESNRHAWEDRVHRYQAQRPDTRFIAPEPTAYAAGVMEILLSEDVSANLMVGKFRDEYLLMGETGAHKRVPQVVGGIDTQTLPFMYATADEFLIGEEIFASGAYLDARWSHIASLRVQDWMRIAIGVAILIGILVKSL